MSIDLLDEDINAAGMYLTDMTTPPQTLSNNPPFYIIPNVEVLNAGEDDPGTTDELYFYLDEPLPFEARLISDVSAQQMTAAEAVFGGATIDTSNANTYVIECPNSEFAQQVAEQAGKINDEGGLVVIFKDFWEALHIRSATATDKNVTVITGATPDSEITGIGSSGLPARTRHLENAGVLFAKPAQMVRYRIEMLALNPDESLIPCLVRDQGLYRLSTIDFAATASQRQIITENVTGFKVYLSVNGGQNWAGLDSNPGNGFPGWNSNQGIRGQIDKQLDLGAGRQSFKSTRGDEHWFRSIPTLVRIDLTTRTAPKRVEFSSTYNPDSPTAEYRTLTQSLIFVPRHFGLPMT